MFLKKNKRCRDCAFSKYHRSEVKIACGYSCHLKPFRPIVMGLFGTHADRKRNKKDQYPKNKKGS